MVGCMPGPMGSILTPLMVGLEEAADLPNACTLNGRCADVCPTSIPLPELMRAHREREHQEKLSPATVRWGIRPGADRYKTPLQAAGLLHTT